MPGPPRVCIGPVGPAADLSSEEKRKQSVQAVWRGFFNRWEGPAAETIQRWWRGHVARRYVRALREGRLLRCGPSQHVRETAAVVIQRHWRGHAARQLAADHRKAVLDIQRWWKGYRARKDWPRLRLRWRALNHYATDIQRWVRGHLARLRYTRERARRRAEAEGEAAAASGTGAAAREDSRREAAAVVVQAHWRGYQARKRRAWLQREAARRERFERRQRAATAIQAGYRGWCVRRAVAARRQAAGGPLAPGSLAGGAVAAPRLAGGDDGIVVPYGSYGDEEDGEDGDLLYGRPAPHGHPEPPPPLRVAVVAGPAGIAAPGGAGGTAKGSGGAESRRGVAGSATGRAAAGASANRTRTARLPTGAKEAAAGSGLASVRATRAGKAAADGSAAAMVVVAAVAGATMCGDIQQQQSARLDQGQEHEGKAGGREAGQVTRGSSGAVPDAVAGADGTESTSVTARTGVLVPAPPGTPPPPGPLGSRARPLGSPGLRPAGPPSPLGSQQQPQQPVAVPRSPRGHGSPRAVAGQQGSEGGGAEGSSTSAVEGAMVPHSSPSPPTTAPPPLAGPHLLRKTQSMGAAASRASGGAQPTPSSISMHPSRPTGLTVAASQARKGPSASSGSRRATVSEGLAPVRLNHTRADGTSMSTAIAAAPSPRHGPVLGRPPSRQRTLARASTSLSQSTSGGGGMSRAQHAPPPTPSTPRQGVRPGHGAVGAQGLGTASCDEPRGESSCLAAPARCDPLRMSAPELPARMLSNGLTRGRRSSGQQGAVLGGPVRASADGGGVGGTGVRLSLRAQQAAQVQGLRRQAWGPVELTQPRSDARAGTGSGNGTGARASSAARPATQGGSSDGRVRASGQGQAQAQEGLPVHIKAAAASFGGATGGAVRAAGGKGVGVGQGQAQGAPGPQGNPLHKQVMRANRGGVVVVD